MFPYEFFSEFYFAGHWSQQSICRMSHFVTLTERSQRPKPEILRQAIKFRIKVNKDRPDFALAATVVGHTPGLNISTNQIRLTRFWSKRRHQYGI